MREEMTRKPLDEFDLSLIRELEIDARKSSLELAAKLGMSHTTVRRRLQHLLDEGIITFATITDHKNLGYLSLIMLGINTRPGKTDAVATRLASFAYSKMVSATGGHYDLLATIVIGGLEDFAGFVSRDLGAIKDITNIDSMIILEVFKNDWSCLVEKGHLIKRSPGKWHLDEFDIALINELDLQPRETISELARKMGTSRANISKRMQALLDREIIRIVSVPDLSALGYRIWIVLRLKVNPSRIDKIVGKLCLYPNVTQIMMTTGMFELNAAAVFKSREDVYDFVENRVGKISGVMRYEMLINLKNYKRAFGLPPLKERQD